MDAGWIVDDPPSSAGPSNLIPAGWITAKFCSIAAVIGASVANSCDDCVGVTVEASDILDILDDAELKDDVDTDDDMDAEDNDGKLGQVPIKDGNDSVSALLLSM